MHKRWRNPFLSLVVLIALTAILPPTASAHADLVRAEPPVDGLVLSSPGQLVLEFSEPPGAGAAVGLVDDSGNAIGTSMAGVVDRRVIVNIPSLEAGTYTVTWAVTSSTDGHALSGTYAFRVGGGLPPGVATTEDERPATWAIAARWASFSGIAMVFGAFLLSVITPATDSSGWARRRSVLLVLGSGIAVAASLAEPILQSLFAPGNTSVSVVDALNGLPVAWWWRPAAGIPLVLLSLAIAYPWRRRVTRPIAIIGGVLGTAVLLGLAGTSHAAGRETWRGLAIANDLVHQVTTGLWVGGLIALALWWRGRDAESAPTTIRRFSRIAMPLVAVAVVTGLANSSFILPLLALWRERGWDREEISRIVSADYGTVLVVKVAILALALVLAALNRRALATPTGDSGLRTGRIRRMLPFELALVLAVVVGGSALALTAPPVAERPALDRITLVAPTTTDGAEGPYLAHLTVDPARDGDNALTMTISDWDGNVDPFEDPPSIVLTLASLDHGVVRDDVSLDAVRSERWRWSTSGLDLSITGWWRITASISSADAAPTAAAFHVLLPDPNTSSSDEAPRPETDPEAERLFRQANARFAEWRSVRWTEQLGSGTDVLLLTDSAVIDRGPEGPSAYRSSLAYAGAFGVDADPPRRNGRTSITIGDQAWLLTDNGGSWLDQSPTRFQVPAEWSATYAGATNIHLGTTDVVDGRPTQIVTFFSPDQPRQSEAWYAWWIDVETGDVRQVAMIANQHYMVWNYRNINAPITIEPPV